MERFSPIFWISGKDMNKFEITPKQKIMLVLCAKGLTIEEIAEELQISAHTVVATLRESYLRLGANNKAHAVAICLENDLLKV